jgi:hypothetical protein
VSRQIKALEEELGVVLLARGKRSVALTRKFHHGSKKVAKSFS